MILSNKMLQNDKSQKLFSDKERYKDVFTYRVRAQKALQYSYNYYTSELNMI